MQEKLLYTGGVGAVKHAVASTNAINQSEDAVVITWGIP